MNKNANIMKFYNVNNNNRNYIGCVMGVVYGIDLNVVNTTQYISTSWQAQNGYEEIYPLRVNQYGLYVKTKCLCDVRLRINLSDSALANIAIGFRMIQGEKQNDTVQYYIVPGSAGGHNVFYHRHLWLNAGVTYRPIIIKTGDNPAIVKNAEFSVMAISG